MPALLFLIIIALGMLASCQNQPTPHKAVAQFCQYYTIKAVVNPCEYDTFEVDTNLLRSFADGFINPEKLKQCHIGDYLVIEPAGVVRKRWIMERIIKVIHNHPVNPPNGSGSIQVKNPNAGKRIPVEHPSKSDPTNGHPVNSLIGHSMLKAL